MQALMKQLAATLSRQCGIQYEFGPEFLEYSEKKAAGTLGETHLKPLSEIFTEEQLKNIPVDNKVGENYFGHLSQQLKSKGGSAFQAISDRLVLKTSSDLAFGNKGADMLKDKELKATQKDVHGIEANFSKSQREIMKAKLALTDSEADKLARDMAKNKLISLCVQNGTKHKYIAPLSSQAEVKKCYDRIKKLSEQDQLAILRREVKLKKALFSEMPSDFVYFKQYNITAKQMYENLLALHMVDPSDQEIITVEDIYVASESVGTQSANKQAKRSRAPAEEPLRDFSWPLQEEEFVITLQEDGWNLGSVQSYDPQQDSICVQALATLKTRAKDDQGKTYWIYPNEEVVDDFERKHILEIRPSVTLAKNVKRKDLVFALLNREIIEAMWGQLIGSNGSE